MLINLRNAMMTGKRLPYDAEVEYLESTGTQWIDTGMSPYGRSPSVLLDMTALSTSAPKSGYFGTWGQNNTRLQVFRGEDGTGSLGVGTYKNISWVDNVRTTVKLDALTHSAEIYGNTYTGFNTSNDFADYNLYLFWRNNNNGDGTQPAIMRCYACQIWDGSTLVRDYIPVRKGTVGYLYDRVSGKLFGNAGTGDFVLGPDKN